MTSLLLLLLSFLLLLGGSVLFTNAVEWLGHQLRLGQGAVGSILAAVGTALPESLIPVVALIGGSDDGGQVAVGAIIGAPFLLATIALALVAAAAVAFRRRRRQGATIAADGPQSSRDLVWFGACFAVAVVLGLGAPRPLQLIGAIGLVLGYAAYVVRTVRAPAGGNQPLGVLEPLFADSSKADPPTKPQVLGQLLLALALIVGGAHLFVDQVLSVATDLGMSPLVLSLILAPFASELPEKANSILWIRQGKDALALGNITGAMVFQSTLPVAIGLGFTDWELETPSILAAGLAFGGALLAYSLMTRPRRLGALPILGWAGLYAAFVVYVVAVS